MQNPQECGLHRLASVHVSDPNFATQNIVQANIELVLSADVVSLLFPS